MEKVNRVLKDLGLGEKEIVVYLACVDNDGISPMEISKQTGIPRTTIYDILMSLSLKQLVKLEQSDGFTKQQTKVFAKNPSFLREIITKRKEDLSSLELDVLDILPDLKKNFQKNKSNADFQFLPGIDGFTKIYLDSDTVSELVWNPLFPVDIIGRESNRKLISEYLKSIGNKKVAVREIIPLNDWTKHVLILQTEKDINYITKRSFRYVENSFFDTKARIGILKNKCYICCADGDEAWGLIINSKSFSQTLMSFFEVMWTSSKPITLELVKSFGKDNLYETAKKKGEIL